MMGRDLKILINYVTVILLGGGVTCFTACTRNASDHVQTELMGFRIINHDLDTLTNLAWGHNSEDSIHTLLLYEKSDTMFFVFSFYSKENVRQYLLDYHNYRVIGYVEKPEMEYLLLTNINNLHVMQMHLKKYIMPTYKYKKFDYIYHTPLDSVFWNQEKINDAVSGYVKYVNDKIDSVYIDYDPINE